MNSKLFFEKGFQCFHIEENRFLITDAGNEFVSIISEEILNIVERKLYILDKENVALKEVIKLAKRELPL